MSAVPQTGRTASTTYGDIARRAAQQRIESLILANSSNTSTGLALPPKATKPPEKHSRSYPAESLLSTSDKSLNGHDDTQGLGFEGDSSITAHAAFASTFVNHAVQHRSYREAWPKLRAAMAALHELLQMQKAKDDDHFAHEKPLGKEGFANFPMPPLESILPLLRELKKTVPLTFTLICAYGNVDYFTDQCRSVYFATDTFSQATFVIVNAGLYFILQEKMMLARHSDNGDSISSYQAHLNICRDNLETVLAHLNLLLPAQRENVIALVMGASYAIEISKPLLALRLNTAACQLCLTLGYHRAMNQAGEDDDARRQRGVLFWLAYILDRALALRLGRPPILQDYEITLPRKLEYLGEFECHRETIHSFMVHAEVQGKIYEELYSPAGLVRHVEQRKETAQRCADILLAERRKISEKRAKALHDAADGGVEIATMLSMSDELAILSTLTLIYRSIPPTSDGVARGTPRTFSVDCIKMAREAMHVHLECIELVRKSPTLATAYMHWIILFQPFIPFIVLFCHGIESCAIEDLRLIERFMTSLEPWKGLSSQSDRLFQLCQVLNDLATICVEAGQAGSVQRQPEVGELTGFLAGQEESMPENQAEFIDQDIPMDFGLDGWDLGQIDPMSSRQSYQLSDLFTEYYMQVLDASDFLVQDPMRRGSSGRGREY
ncbi:hypothetical protein PV08_05256 [Exophiala spinifera]|uniref:Xylanolytic transcriptional activator regulatory domain-containing protein n=1 Tax=Exophiala spinifera TaxID=91928 RepID=A0A0D1YJQ4_9EURO|nr:uncharacterized protein PV08_05256 [Exophiala spinifera]KIW15211.1 hypothetical protein PV08_05256 [Exophiala spinifera]